MLSRLFAALSFLLFFQPLLQAQPGALDSAFGRAGRVTTNIFSSDDQGFAVLLRPDGRIVSIGRAAVDSVDQFAAVQQLPDGRLDETFNFDGKTTPWLTGQKAFAYAGALYPDGRVIMGGFVGEFLDKDFALLRLTPEGAPDTSFNGTGWLDTDFAGGEDDAEAVLLQPDGKIVAAGFTSVDGVEADFALARYLENGQLDPDFGDGGLVVRSFSAVSDVIFDAELQPDGHIVATGQTYDDFFASDFIVARFRPDGQLDSTFGTNGFAVSDVAPDDIGRAVTLQADGKIVVAGISVVDFIPKIGVVRFHPDGSPDLGFGLNGQIVLEAVPLGNFCTDALVQPDGKILLGGMVEGGATGDFRDFFVMRLLSDGTPDAGFGLGGITVVSLSQYDDNAYRLALQPDGSVLLVGVAAGDFALLRLSADGKVDQNFGNGGSTRTDAGNSYDDLNTLLVQPDGKIVAGGLAFEAQLFDSRQWAVINRYEPEGRIDSAFGNVGIQTGAGPFYRGIGALALQPDGKIVGAGRFNGKAGLIRLLPDGALDDNFGVNGLASSPYPDPSYYNSLDLRPDGRIIAGGVSPAGSTKMMIQYLPNGQIDLDFGINGEAQLPPGLSTWFKIAFREPDGIYALGSGPAGMVIVRIDADGAMDLNFGNNGQVVFNSVTGEAISDFILLPSGKILVAGGNTDVFVTRLQANGQLDSTFGVNGAVLHDYDQSINSATALALQADGRILVCGNSANTPNPDNLMVLRLLPDGQVDPAFGLDGWANLGPAGAGKAIFVQADVNIMVGGNFWNGNDADFLLVRLLNTPSVGLIDRPNENMIVDFYPNPVADLLQVEYELTENQRVTLTLFDAAGRVVATLLDGENRPAGQQKESLQLPAGLPRGHYNLVFRTSKGVKTLIIIKS